MKRIFKPAICAALLIGSASIGALPAQAQVAALLPNISEVAPTKASAVDGTYIIKESGKRITIENGRAYAVDTWMHGPFLQIQPEMVVLRNFTQLTPTQFTADDLPLLGKAKMLRNMDRSLLVVVAGPLGTIKYTLLPTELVRLGTDQIDNPKAEDPPSPPPPPPPPPPKPRIYQMWISAASCDGTSLFRKNYRGNFSISVDDAKGNRLSSGPQSFALKCTRKGPRNQHYSYDSEGAGALLLNVPPGEDGFTNFTIRTTLNDLLGPLDLLHDKSAIFLRARMISGGLQVGSSVDTVEQVASGKAALKLRVYLKRVQ